MELNQLFNITPKTEPDRVAYVKPEDVRDEEFKQYTQALQAMVATCVGNGVFTAAKMFDACAKHHGNNVCLREVGSDRSFTYTEVNHMANRVARWVRAQGLKQRDVVALMMENSPEFLWTSIGLIRGGCVPALINTNLEGDRLAHAVQISLAPIAIVSVKHAKQWEISRDDFERKGFRGKVIWAAGKTPLDKIGRSDLMDYDLRTFTPYPDPPKAWQAGLLPTDPAYYIYTSGTTGNSKAVRMPHAILYLYMGVSQFLKLNKDDVYYNCLPLYHSAGTLGCYTSFYKGATVVIREKFSPSNFWKDIKKFQCTAMVYIGELWTYLLKQAVCPEERNNTLQKINGNGLRANVWTELQNRFQIPTIVEYFGQTEAPNGRKSRALSNINVYGKPGSCGYMPKFVQDDPDQDFVLLEFDLDTNKPRRFGRDQFCRRVARGTPGLAVAELTVSEHKIDLYTSKEASMKPILRDVLKKGDMYYSTGDLLRVDEEGFLFFVDRTGDTYRWKGENVSTNEVCAIMSTFPSILEANVYGVKIPASPDGRAGMASVTVKPGHKLDIPALQAHCSKLPSYAQPVFLRVSEASEFEKTSTFKFQKTKFQADGFDPAKCAPDQIWYSDRNRPYVKMTPRILAELMRTPSKL